MNKKNIILIVVDAVRSYKSGRDERDRLDVYNELVDKGFFAFDKLVVSAPSSVMSSITMLTGLPSFMLARNYNDFKWEPDLYDVLPTNLSKKGYDCYGLFGTKEMRDKMKGVFPPIKTEFLSDGINVRQNKWSNKELFSVVKKCFEKSIHSNNTPFFMMAWFNSRFDPKTSLTISELMEYIEQKGYFDDSLVIVTADHGYPDQRRGLTSDGVDLKKAGIPHDLIVTDDNICVPLAVRFPAAYEKSEQLLAQFPNRLVSTVISQESLAPTMCDVLDVRLDDKPIKPKRGEILSEIENDSISPIRSDARFIFQPNRITSVRSSLYKYVIDREAGQEFYYDLRSDPLEDQKLTSLNNHAHELKLLYEDTEREALELWIAKIENKLVDYNFIDMLDEKEEFNVFFLGSTGFILPFLKHLDKYNYPINLYCINKHIEKNIRDINVNFCLVEGHSSSNAIVVLEDSLNNALVDQFKFIDVKKIRIIDAHLNVTKSRRVLMLRSWINVATGPFNRMFFRRELYQEDPALLFSDILYIFKRSITLVVSKLLQAISGKN